MRKPSPLFLFHYHSLAKRKKIINQTVKPFSYYLVKHFIWKKINQQKKKY